MSYFCNLISNSRYGNIRKNFVVTTNRVKEMFEMADDRDVMEVTLKGDAVISEQITSSAKLKDGEDGGYQGRLALNLMGYKLDWQAPIVMKGGILDIGADYYGGTITVSSEFIHAGADADENNNYISIIVNPCITVDCASAWVKAVGANSELTKNKIVSVALNNLEEGKDAKISVGTGYSKDENGNVLLK